MSEYKTYTFDVELFPVEDPEPGVSVAIGGQGTEATFQGSAQLIQGLVRRMPQEITIPADADPQVEGVELLGQLFDSALNLAHQDYLAQLAPGETAVSRCRFEKLINNSEPSGTSGLPWKPSATKWLHCVERNEEGKIIKVHYSKPVEDTDPSEALYCEMVFTPK